jgi:hypothetical protein
LKAFPDYSEYPVFASSCQAKGFSGYYLLIANKSITKLQFFK